MAKERENEEDEEFKEDTSEINDSNESKISNCKIEKAFIISLLAKQFSLKVTQAVIFSINTYKQDIITVGNKNQKKFKDRWNYCNNIPMLSLFGANHRLPLFHMAKHFIWLNETKKRINEFTIGYMINPGLNINKAFREKVGKCMYTSFGEITQPFIKPTLLKNNTSVLFLIIFYEKRAYNPKKAFRVLSCDIYTIIKNYVCIDYLACK